MPCPPLPFPLEKRIAPYEHWITNSRTGEQRLAQLWTSGKRETRREKELEGNDEYYLGSRHNYASTCKSSVPESQCLCAVNAALKLISTAKQTNLAKGSWDHVQKGCTAEESSGRPHWNSGMWWMRRDYGGLPGGNYYGYPRRPTNYRPVCRRKTTKPAAGSEIYGHGRWKPRASDYVYQDIGVAECPAGSETVPEEMCADAVWAARADAAVGQPPMSVGSWQHIPMGCSADSASIPHFNTWALSDCLTSTRNRLLCVRTHGDQWLPTDSFTFSGYPGEVNTAAEYGSNISNYCTFPALFGKSTHRAQDGAACSGGVSSNSEGKPQTVAWCPTTSHYAKRASLPPQADCAASQNTQGPTNMNYTSHIERGKDCDSMDGFHFLLSGQRVEYEDCEMACSNASKAVAVWVNGAPRGSLCNAFSWGPSSGKCTIYAGCTAVLDNTVTNTYWMEEANRTIPSPGAAAAHTQIECAQPPLASGIIFGDRVVQIGKWRIGEYDESHVSISHRDGERSVVYDSDGNTVTRTDDYWLWSRKIGKPNRVSLGDRFLQIGDWRLGDVNSVHFSIAHRMGVTVVTYSGNDKESSPLNGALWERDSVTGTGAPGRVSFGDRYLQIGDWRFGETDASSFAAVHRNGRMASASVYGSDGATGNQGAPAGLWRRRQRAACFAVALPEEWSHLRPTYVVTKGPGKQPSLEACGARVKADPACGSKFVYSIGSKRCICQTPSQQCIPTPVAQSDAQQDSVSVYEFAKQALVRGEGTVRDRDDTRCSWGGSCPNGGLAEASVRQADHHCGACNTGFYLDTAARTCTACPNGQFQDADDLHEFTECKPTRACQPGTLLVGTSSAIEDYTCQPCPPGRFQSEVSHQVTTCNQTHADVSCSKGELLVMAQDATQDNLCERCTNGTFRAEAVHNFTVCGTYSTVRCRAGHFVQQSHSPDTDNVCQTCPAGFFRAGNHASSWGVLPQCCTSALIRALLGLWGWGS